MVEQVFWKPEPKTPFKDWRTYSMLLPIVSGATGACIFSALGLAFAEILAIRPEVRKPLILVAAFGVAIGSTFGSIGSGIEVFRKSHKNQAKVWDWISLSVSIVTTILGMVIGVATLLGGTTSWSQAAVIWGSAVVCGFSALDSAGDMIELGGLFGSYEDRYEMWLQEKRVFDVENGQDVSVTPEFVSRLEAMENKIERLSWPAVTKKEWEGLTSGLNGQTPETMSEAEEFLAQHKRKLPNPRTALRWGLKA